MPNKSRNAWLRLLAFSLLLGLSVPPRAAGLEPTAAHAVAQKNRALQLFSDDAKVRAAITALANRGYKLLSSDAAPYRFVYGDEGPISNFLVSAWLGKPEAYGWSPAFVMAKVSTDAFGPPTVTLVDAGDIQRFLR